MDDAEDRSLTDEPAAGHGGTLENDRERDGVIGDAQQQLAGATSPNPIGNGVVSARYREILRHQADEGSETGSSVDAAPKRAGSPIDSLLSVPDETPSLHVREKKP